MTTEVHELPEIGEIVVATITKITDHGAYATLDEYNNIQGFLHASEVAHGWVRNINKFVKSGEKKVLLVKRIKEGREEIDLSLKQVSRDQQKKKFVDVKRFEKGKSIIKSVQEKAKLSSSDVEKLEDKIFSKYDSVYDGVVDIATNGIKVFGDLKLPKKTLDVIEEVSMKIKGAPKYRITVTAADFKSAEKTLKPILEDIQKNIEKNKGSFKFTREESRKTGGE